MNAGVVSAQEWCLQVLAGGVYERYDVSQRSDYYMALSSESCSEKSLGILGSAKAVVNNLPAAGKFDLQRHKKACINYNETSHLSEELKLSAQVASSIVFDAFKYCLSVAINPQVVKLAAVQSEDLRTVAFSARFTSPLSGNNGKADVLVGSITLPQGMSAKTCKCTGGPESACRVDLEARTIRLNIPSDQVVLFACERNSPLPMNLVLASNYRPVEANIPAIDITPRAMVVHSEELRSNCPNSGPVKSIAPAVVLWNVKEPSATLLFRGRTPATSGSKTIEIPIDSSGDTSVSLGARYFSASSENPSPWGMELIVHGLPPGSPGLRLVTKRGNANCNRPQNWDTVKVNDLGIRFMVHNWNGALPD